MLSLCKLIIVCVCAIVPSKSCWIKTIRIVTSLWVFQLLHSTGHPPPFLHCDVHLMYLDEWTWVTMYSTNKVYHRRTLSYWFHIICNSHYLPSRPFLSLLRFMQLCPFLIIVTDRRSAEKDGENERESRHFVTAVAVCECLHAGGCGCRYLSYRSRPLPTPIPLILFYSLSYVEGCINQS